MAEKHVPQRMCVSCRQMKDKTALLRVVCADGVGEVDLCGKRSGRGLYVCKDLSCVERLRKNKGFSKQHGFEITDKLFEELKAACER